MADFDVIAAVSETLRKRLDEEMRGLFPTSSADVAVLHDLIGLQASNTPLLTLFLYDIVEEPTTRNRRKSTRVVAGDLLVRKQPLGLGLYYMVTAWAGDRDTEHRMLGRVLQALYEDAFLDGAQLQGALAGTPAELRVSLAPMHLEDRSRIWFAIGNNYRLSLNYELRLVDIDVRTGQTMAPVRERHLDAGVVTS